MTSIEIVKQVVDDTAEKDEKTLLETLHDLLINNPKQFESSDIQFAINSFKSSGNNDFPSKIEHIISRSKASLPMYKFNENNSSLPINSVHKVNISAFLCYDLEVICNFVRWIFQRQYGWVDKCGMEEDDVPCSNSISAVDHSCEHRVKSLLSDFIVWYV